MHYFLEFLTIYDIQGAVYKKSNRRDRPSAMSSGPNGSARRISSLYLQLPFCSSIKRE